MTEKAENSKLWAVFMSIGLMTSTYVHAQEVEGGLNAELSFAQRLNLNSSNESSFQTSVGFILTSGTKNETFTLSTGTSLEYQFDDNRYEISNPDLNLTYSRESLQNLLSTAYNFRRTDTNSLVIANGRFPNVLILDDGKRDDIASSTRFEFGRASSFGGSVDIGYRTTRFKETRDPDLFDTEQLTIGNNLRFDIDQRSSLNVGLDYSATNRDNDRDTRSYQVSIGASVSITPTLDGSFSFGRSKVETQDGNAPSVDEGLTYALNFTQALPRGALTYGLTSNVSETGRRTTGKLGSSYETQRGTLSWEIGVTRGEDANLRPLIELSYQDELPRASYSVSINQDFSTDNIGNEILNSRVQFGWAQDLTERVQLNASLGYQKSENVAIDSETSRLDLELGMQQALSNQWALNANFRRSWQSETGQLDEQSDDLFVGVQRNFRWRP